MAIATTPAARRYARALFEVAREGGALAAVSADVRLLGGITAHPEVSGWLADPRVEDRLKRELLHRQLAARCHPLTLGFLKIVASRRRHGVLPQVPAAFQDLTDRHEGRIRGLVESARPLGAAEQARLEAALAAKTGRQVALDARVAAELLGGVRVTLDGVRYDGTARGRLDTLKRRLQQAELGHSPASLS